MHELASQPGADPSLDVQMENQNRLAMEAGQAAFQLNYPFVYPAMKAGQPQAVQGFKWALYPEVMPGHPGQGHDRRHGPRGQPLLPAQALAFQAALCLRNRANQIIGANVGGSRPP